MYTGEEHSTRQLGMEPRGVEPSNPRVVMQSMYQSKPNSSSHLPTAHSAFGSFLCKNWELANLIDAIMDLSIIADGLH